ncbi:MAG TPA: molecular chaperone [Novosphingobium sp.]|nr:molecular chaperone [Novosphingobium sp.]
MPFGNYLTRALGALGALALALVAIAPPAAAQGDLLIAPTRVVMNGGSNAQVILSNIGATPATYRITLELRRMLPDGSLDDVAQTDANAAEAAALAMIRYAPRRITLEPGQPQSVRITARPGAELLDGEYRVHMSFRAVPDATPVAPTTADPAPVTGLQIKLTPIYGITIPVIVRKGQLDASATIASPQVLREGTGASLNLALTRSGARSVYGEIRAIPRGAREPVFLVRGIAIYPELTARTLSLPLSPEQAAALKGPLRFEYREPDESGGKLIASLDATL